MFGVRECSPREETERGKERKQRAQKRKKAIDKGNGRFEGTKYLRNREIFLDDDDDDEDNDTTLFEAESPSFPSGTVIKDGTVFQGYTILINMYRKITAKVGIKRNVKIA